MCLVVRRLCISVTSSLYLSRNTVTGSDILANWMPFLQHLPYPSSNVLMLTILNKNRNIPPYVVRVPRPPRAQKKSDLHVIWWGVLVHHVSCMALFMLGVFLCIRVLLWTADAKTWHSLLWSFEGFWESANFSVRRHSFCMAENWATFFFLF